MGRWISRDPLHTINGPNVYAYVINNPINYNDPTGLIFWVPLLLAGWAAFEVGMAIYDIYDTYDTFTDPSASNMDKGMAILGLGLGVVGPGGGYNSAYKGGKKVCQNLRRYNGPKPKYHVNPQHVPGRGLHPRKTPLPKDAEDVYRNAVPSKLDGPGAWYGRNSNGDLYRFSYANDGTAHFSGIITDYSKLPPYLRDRLGL